MRRVSDISIRGKAVSVFVTKLAPKPVALKSRLPAKVSIDKSTSASAKAAVPANPGSCR
jgi:hypothetical protein